MPVSYENLFNQAQQQYSGILGGYASALASQQAAQQQTMAGYNQLQNQVLGGLATQGRTRSADIASRYTDLQGQMMGNFINRGLTNSTIMAGATMRIAGEEQRAQNALTEDIARLNAQYQSQLGLAGLGYQAQANAQNQALLREQLGYMSGWQNNLLGVALQGMSREDAYRNQMLMQQGRWGIVGGSSGRGGYGTIGGGRAYGYAGGYAEPGSSGGYYPGWTPAGAGYMNFGAEASPMDYWGVQDSRVVGYEPGYSGDLLASMAGGASVTDLEYLSPEDEAFWYGGD